MLHPMSNCLIFSAKTLSTAIQALSGFTNYALSEKLEAIRLSRACYCLLSAGVTSKATLITDCIEQIIRSQQGDGGWIDPEETAWSMACIYLTLGQASPVFSSALQWLDSLRRPSGGWGRHKRDQARIPTTAIVSALVPSVIRSDDIVWLTNEWQRDFEGTVRLSYKAGFFLLAMPERDANALISQTIDHLSKDQNEDGGFGPWRGHPIGSDPWSTGVVLWGLSRWINIVDRAVIHKAISWLERTQLPNGYWPYHYHDDGTSLALIGAVSALKALASKEKLCAQSS